MRYMSFRVSGACDFDVGCRLSFKITTIESVTDSILTIVCFRVQLVNPVKALSI
jgi:hypothetical protein